MYLLQTAPCFLSPVLSEYDISLCSTVSSIQWRIQTGSMEPPFANDALPFAEIPSSFMYIDFSYKLRSASINLYAVSNLPGPVVGKNC